MDKQEFLKVHDTLCGRKGGMRIQAGIFANDKETLFRKIDLCEDGRIDADEWAYYASAALRAPTGPVACGIESPGVSGRLDMSRLKSLCVNGR